MWRARAMNAMEGGPASRTRDFHWSSFSFDAREGAGLVRIDPIR
jgi:hypothetical protein